MSTSCSDAVSDVRLTGDNGISKLMFFWLVGWNQNWLTFTHTHTLAEFPGQGQTHTHTCRVGHCKDPLSSSITGLSS